MLGINIRELALNEVNKAVAVVEKIDLNHNGISDLKEIKKDIEEGVAEIQALEAEVTPAEAAAALNMLFPGKFSAEKIAAGEAALAKVLGAVGKIGPLVAAAKAAL